MKHIKLYEELVTEAKKIKDRGEAGLPDYYDAVKSYFGPEQQEALEDLGVEVEWDGPNNVICRWKTEKGGRAVRAEVLRLLKKVFKGGWPSNLLRDWDHYFYDAERAAPQRRPALTFTNEQALDEKLTLWKKPHAEAARAVTEAVLGCKKKINELDMAELLALLATELKQNPRYDALEKYLDADGALDEAAPSTWTKEKIAKELGELKRGAGEAGGIDDSTAFDIAESWLSENPGVEAAIKRHYGASDAAGFVANWIA